MAWGEPMNQVYWRINASFGLDELKWPICTKANGYVKECLLNFNLLRDFKEPNEMISEILLDEMK